jgi:PadR family transcriptional regulator PadR
MYDHLAVRQWTRHHGRCSASTERDSERLPTVRIVLSVTDDTSFRTHIIYIIYGRSGQIPARSAGHHTSLDEPHGLALKDELEDYDEADIYHGRLYPNIDILIEQGLIEEGIKGHRTNDDLLTRRGWQEIDTRSKWEA